MRQIHSKGVKAFYKLYTACILIFILLVYVNLRDLVRNDKSNLKQAATAAFNSDIKENIQVDSNNDVHHSRQLLQSSGQDVECRNVHRIHNPIEKCQFVQNTSSCDPEGYINYNYFTYCQMGHSVWAAVLILSIMVYQRWPSSDNKKVFWWLFCFVGLAVTADDFFCPSLVVISSTLKLSPNVAGVTFLAFGNGAPDLFSALAALSTSGDAELGVGGLLGAGMFVTTVVTGTIAIISPFKARERPFQRDIVFYIFGVFWTFATLWNGKISLGESIGFICFYIIYVIVVIVSRSIYKKRKDKALDAHARATAANTEVQNNGVVPEDVQNDAPVFTLTHGNNQRSNIQYDISTLPCDDHVVNQSDGIYENSHIGPYDIDVNSNEEQKYFELGTLENGTPSMAAHQLPKNKYISRRFSQDSLSTTTSSDVGLCDDIEDSIQIIDSPAKSFLKAINPINIEEWPNMGIIKKVYEIFKCPIIFILLLTCPVVDYDVEDSHNWNKYLQCLQCLISPVIMSLLASFGFHKLGGVFPIWALMIFVGIAIALIVFFTSVHHEKPRYHWVFAYIGFLISMIWIYTIANIIVNILQTFGIVFNISGAILGLTLLAWGNSIGDWIADTVMARQGFARMGFAACFGAPFFNLMLGFGLPMLIIMVRTGVTQVLLTITPVQLILNGFLLGNLCFNFLFLNISGFKVNRLYGIIVMCCYIIFLTMAILTESGVMLSDWTQKRYCVVDCQ